MTGYTYSLLKEGQSFNDFMWGITKAFAFVDRESKDIKPYQDDSDYYQRKLNNTTIQLERWNSMTISEKRSKILSEIEDSINHLEETIKENKKINSIIENTISKVKSLKLPTIFTNFKNFVFQQLETSRPYSTIKELEQEIKALKSITLSEIDKRIELKKNSMERDITNCQQEIKKQKEINESRLHYFNEFKKVIPLPESQKSS